jgi:hypothetical protein
MRKYDILFNKFDRWLLTLTAFLKAPEWKRAYMCVSQHLFSHHQISQDGVGGWSCDSDYRGLKKRIMAMKSAQQDGNDLHLTRTMSSDSEHESLPSPAGTSKWTRSPSHRENPDGARAAQDEQKKQPVAMDARGTQIELDELRMGGDDIPNVSAFLLSQCVYSPFFIPKRRPLHLTTSPLLSRIQVL